LQEVEGQPECAPHRALHLPAAQELVVGTRPGLGDVVVPAGQVGGRGQPLQVLRAQRGVAVGGREPGVGIRPRLAREGLSTLLERISAGHVLAP
jgi:hypothetical protein